MPLRERLGALLGIPSDAVGLENGVMVELRGQGAVAVRGCRRILTYSPDVIRLDTLDGAITLVGDGLTCTTYASDLIGIEGRIGGVYFDRFGETLLHRLREAVPTGADE